MTSDNNFQVQQLEQSKKATYKSLIVAITIISIWVISLVSLLSIDINKLNTFTLLAAIIWQTFVYTGLFITAHDAMHGSIFPSNIKINHLIGALCLILYGCLPYKKLLKKHWQHHQNPASELDPDFHNGKYHNFFAWYLYFMRRYWSWRQIITLMIIFNVITHTLHISEDNLRYFWVIPPILSALQLFYFGTFEPHREPASGYTEPHRSHTIRRPAWLSFITCYHFGYHEEHHEHPHLPWWRLPEAYQNRLG
ncbi:MAG: fatty acid desaturase [Calothrix sp. C42_A2020_038]|nr:fatty acid desaturase [Calothrix sp. C42_A2020_038]